MENGSKIQELGVEFLKMFIDEYIYRSWFLGYVDKTVVGAALSK